ARIYGFSNAGSERFRRVVAEEPAELRGIADRREAEIDEQALQILDVVRVAVHADDIGLLTRRRTKERSQQRAALAPAARGQVESCEPEFIAGGFDRAEKSEPDRGHAAVAVVRPEHVARNGDGGELAGADVLDKVAGDERALQLGEEFLAGRGIDGEIAVEAAVRRTLAD